MLKRAFLVVLAVAAFAFKAHNSAALESSRDESSTIQKYLFDPELRKVVRFPQQKLRTRDAGPKMWSRTQNGAGYGGTWNGSGWNVQIQNTAIGSSTSAGTGWGVDTSPSSSVISETITSSGVTGSSDIQISSNTCTAGHNMLAGNCRFSVAYTPAAADTAASTSLGINIHFVVVDSQGKTSSSDVGVRWNFSGTSYKPCPTCEARAKGSIIGIENQSLGESIPIVGADFQLFYSSMYMSQYLNSNYAIGKKHFLNPEGWAPGLQHYYDSTKALLFKGNGTVESHANYVDPATGNFWVLNQDASELYIFAAASGRHIKTLTGLTGALKYSFGYDAAGYLTTMTDGYGNITTFTRNASELLTSIVGPYGQTTTVTENAGGNLATVTNPNNETYTMTYNSSSALLHTFQKPGLQTSTFTFDSNGRLTQDAGAGGNSWNLSQAVSGGTTTTTMTSQIGRTTTIATSYNASAQRVTSTAFPDTNLASSQNTFEGARLYQDHEQQITSQVVYDERFGGAYSRPYSTSFSVGGVSTVINYGQTVSYDPSVTDQGFFDYKTLTKTVAVGGGTTTYVFDAPSKTRSTVSATGATSSITLDVHEHPVQVQRGSDIARTFTYDTHGRIATQGQGTQDNYTYAYDANGKVHSVTNGRSEVTTYGYDLSARRNQVTLPDLRTIQYSYDSNGNITGFTTPSSMLHTVALNAFELASTYTPPVVTGAGATTYGYNLDKQLNLVTFPSGETISYNYNTTTGQLASVVEGSTGNGFSTFNYSYGGANTDQVSSIVNSGYATANVFGYNGYEINYDYQYRPSDGYLYGLATFSYDSNQNIASRTIRGNAATPTATRNYTYDNDFRMTSIGSMSLAYDTVSGRLSTTTLGGVSDSRTYDSYGRISTYTATYTPSGGSPTVLYSSTLTYDNMSRTVGKSETVSGVTSAYVYSYDTAGRLTGVTKNGTSVASYTYDSNSNRTSTTLNGVTNGATFDNQDRILSFGSSTYTPDANGRVHQVQTSVGAISTFTYDPLGNLSSATTPTNSLQYGIDGRNRIVWKKLNGVGARRFLYDGLNNIAAELNSSAVVTKEYVYGARRIPEYIVTPSATLRVIADGAGSVRLVVNVATGGIAEKLDYDANGAITVDTSPGFQPFGYAGGLWDGDLGLYRFGARYYDPLTGRWTAKDPVIFNSGDSNLYGYALNDPINFVDSDGFAATNYHNGAGGRDPSGTTGGPTNGNWGGGGWSGGLGKGQEGPPAPPVDSGDECYMHHDQCYERAEEKTCSSPSIASCDEALVKCLAKLPMNPLNWPMPPPPGTITDTITYLHGALIWFGGPPNIK